LGDVVGFEVFPEVAEAQDDVGIGEAIEEPMVDLVPDGFREAGDFAV
jgi:hypothetical protein